MSGPAAEQAHPRDRAARAAVALVQGDMTVGLGSGDTASRAIGFLGEAVRTGLRVTAVATSETSAALGRRVGLTVVSPDAVASIDLTIDGADEIDPQLRLIKGAGAAHTRERLVARASRELVIVADSGKLVPRLGARMRLPVELLPFAQRWTVAALASLGLDPRLREHDGALVFTDNGGPIADCVLAADQDLGALALALDTLPGVVDHGLFLTEATIALVGTSSGVDRLTRPRP